MQSPQKHAQLPLWLFLLAALLLAIPFHLRPDNFIVDDGYFYPQIARYIVHGQGSTFNGIMPTNGYHPLWMLVCVVGAWITSASSPLIQLLAGVQDFLILVALTLLVMVSRSARKQGSFVGCLPILFFSMVLGIWRLLEANLALTLQLCVLIALLPLLPAVQQRIGRWRDAIVGLLLGLTMLSRLDLVFFVGVVLAFDLFSGHLGRGWKARLQAFAIQCAVLAGTLAPYLAWNMLRFHHLMPVSGAIKSTFPHVRDWNLPFYTIPVIAAILLNCCLLLKRERTDFDRMCLLTAAGAALHLAYTLLFGGLAPWYLTTGCLTLALCLTWVFDLAVGRRRSLRRLEPALCFLAWVVFFCLASLRLFSNYTYTRYTHGDIAFNRSYVEPKRALADALRSALPPRSRIFIFDAPGGVAYYSGMSLLPADGLVSDYAYSAALAREGFAQYAADKHIDYFIAPYLQPGQDYDRLFLRGRRSGSDQVMQIVIPLTRTPGGLVTLRGSDLLFRFREINPDLQESIPEIGVWRLRHAATE